MENATGETKHRPLPLIQAIIYSSGYFGVYLISFSVATVPQILYVPETGASMISSVAIGRLLLVGGVLFGLLNGFGRVIDAVVDPWIGNLSDHWRSRWGRRKPFILVGAPLMGIFFVLFTLPPSSDPSLANIAYLAIIYPLFFLFYTAALTPYLAMLPEITRTPSERLLVTTLQSVFLIMGTFTAVLMIGEMPHDLSFTDGAIVIAVLSCVPLLLVAAFVKTPGMTDQESVPKKRPSTISQIRDALGFAPFRIYLLSLMTFFFGFEMVKNSARYVAVHLFGDVEAYTLILGTALGVAAICGVGAYWLGKTIGKKKSLIMMSIMFLILMPFIALIGRGPLASPIAGYVLYGLMGIPISILLVMPNSLLADIINLDTEQTGKKREALYFASQALLNKMGIAFSKMTMNLVLPIGAISSFTEAAHKNVLIFLLPIEDVAAVIATLTNAVGETGIRLIGPVAAFFVLVGLLIFLKFPDVEKK